MPHSEEWGAKLQKDSPDLVLRLERSPPTPGSGDTLRGSCGQRARARARGCAWRAITAAPGTARARALAADHRRRPRPAGCAGARPLPGARSQAGAPHPRGREGGGAAPAPGERHGWRVLTGRPRARQGLLLTPPTSAFHQWQGGTSQGAGAVCWEGGGVFCP